MLFLTASVAAFSNPLTQQQQQQVLAVISLVIFYVQPH
jgi:hypothetical protein